MPLTHFNAAGQAHMVDVGDKAGTHRVAVATGCIRMQAGTWARIRGADHRKGDVLGVARIAAIQAAKRTAELIPLCHPVPLTHVDVQLEAAGDADSDWRVDCTVRVECHARTGVEMEALTAVQIGLLTVYDMCKAVDRGMRIDGVRVLSKTGGASGDWAAD